jgi:hypothetical protein
MTSSRALKVAAYSVVSVIALVMVVFFTGAEHWQYSRRMDCEKQVDARAHEICMSIERHLEYTCCGHAIISPGYRSTWTTVTKVWCEQRIEQKDATLLRALTKARDWRLSSAADSLLRLLTGRDQYGAEESETSSLHPANPSYLLKDGCPKRTEG